MKRFELGNHYCYKGGGVYAKQIENYYRNAGIGADGRALRTGIRLERPRTHERSVFGVHPVDACDQGPGESTAEVESKIQRLGGEGGQGGAGRLRGRQGHHDFHDRGNVGGRDQEGFDLYEGWETRWKPARGESRPGEEYRV